MNVPTKEHLNIVRPEEESANELVRKRSEQTVILQERGYLVSIGKMNPKRLLGKHNYGS